MAVFHEEGTYRARINDARLSEAKTKTPQVEIELELLAAIGKDGEEYEPQVGRFPPIIYLAVTEKTMGAPGQSGWVADTLKYLGFQGDFEALTTDLKDREVEVYCQYETGQDGQQREKWSISRPRTPKPPPERSEVRKLNTQFAGLFKPKGAKPTPPPAEPKNGRKPRKPADPPPEEPADANQEGAAAAKDDIPF